MFSRAWRRFLFLTLNSSDVLIYRHQKQRNEMSKMQEIPICINKLGTPPALVPMITSLPRFVTSPNLGTFELGDAPIRRRPSMQDAQEYEDICHGHAVVQFPI